MTLRPHIRRGCLVLSVGSAWRHKQTGDTVTIQPGPEDGLPDPSLAALIGERRRLINLAYRLLGSLSEAEDVVQETYARWYTMSRQQQDAVESVGGWLTTVATRICLNLLRSARARRERYVGEWIPEPLPEPTERPGGGPVAAAGDPADHVTLDESVNMAFLVVLEYMTPAERVAFILHDVFHYAFAEVAEIVGRSPAACRQLASSARRRLRDARPASHPMPADHAGIVRNFKHAWEAKDIGALIGLLDPGVTAVGDGGGRVTAVLHPVEGGERVARFLLELAEKASGVVFLERAVNGRPGLVAQRAGATVAVYAFDIDGDRIKHIWAVGNPEKLRPWTTGTVYP
ncbi:RNA polymerase sigma factor SigJ [Streptomyces sp. 5-8]|uniref:RNA polymerase sigma factor SigJ n=1 Tax=Streptomyces musisoli TaxID=2802280 RepID=A0ABS1NWS5_9ACTN|nr:RNA polymerase sigma factor SigJ [Streptomyces musisoli]